MLSSLLETLGRQKRTDWDVYLVARPGLKYSPKSSILNRLIVSQLVRLDCLKFLEDETDVITYNAQKNNYRVKFVSKRVQDFDRVITHYGPKSALEEFPVIYAKCRELQDKWRGRSTYEDKSRLKLWDDDLFEQTASAPAGPATVYAHEIRIWKDVANDGNCFLRYYIDGLSVKEGELHFLQFSYQSWAGSVGTPVLDAGATSGIKWQSDSPTLDVTLPLPKIRDWVRTVAGRFSFDPPLKAGRSPVDLDFTLTILNGHARTAWECKQVYESGKHRDLAGKELDGAESFARTVWFPIERLSITLSLPESIKAEPRARAFRYLRPKRSLGTDPKGTLRMDHSDLKPTEWKCLSDEDVSTQVRLKSHYVGNSWDLIVSNPKVGHAFGLEWCLPRAPHSPKGTKTAAQMRAVFVKHAFSRAKGRTGGGRINAAFSRLVSQLNKRYRLDVGDERFDVSFMTYDDKSHELLVVEASENGRDRKPFPADFRLPYGLGVAGASFKEGQLRLYIRPDGEPQPQLYFPARGGDRKLVIRQVLLACPVFVPEFEEIKAQTGPRDRSRYCIGIVNVGSNRSDTKLSQLDDSKEQEWIWKLSNQFALRSFSENGTIKSI